MLGSASNSSKNHSPEKKMKMEVEGNCNLSEKGEKHYLRNHSKFNEK